MCCYLPPSSWWIHSGGQCQLNTDKCKHKCVGNDIFTQSVIEISIFTLQWSSYHVVELIQKGNSDKNKILQYFACSPINCELISYGHTLNRSGSGLHLYFIQSISENNAHRELSGSSLLKWMIPAVLFLKICMNAHVPLNSFRPSDAYMRQWINQHWFR